jgi:hypothetical protein
MTEPGFDTDALARLRESREVRIETRGPREAVHRIIIWVVVDSSNRVLIRSHRGAGARWYREAVAAGNATLLFADVTLPVRVEDATDRDRVAACSAELERKYAGDPSMPSMLREEILDTTLELHPA